MTTTPTTTTTKCRAAKMRSLRNIGVTKKNYAIIAKTIDRRKRFKITFMTNNVNAQAHSFYKFYLHFKRDSALCS